MDRSVTSTDAVATLLAVFVSGLSPDTVDHVGLRADRGSAW